MTIPPAPPVRSAATRFLSRRGFLGALPAAAATLRAQPNEDRRVLIAGAGMAGLVCAHQLLRRGYDVTLFEGQGRPGGRVQTLREGLAPGITAEAGATRIPDTHDLTLSYVREFGLALEPFHPPVGEDAFYLRGRSYTSRGGKEPEWPLNLTAEERKLGRDGLAEKHLMPPIRAALPHAKSPQIPPSVSAADHGTIGEYLAQRGLSADAVELVNLGFATSISAGLILLVESSSHVNKGYFHIAGGNDRLPAALSARLAGRIHYGCRIVGFEQDGRSASLVVESNGERRKHAAPHVICTLPFSVTRGLFNSARLSPRKLELTQSLAYGASTKVFLQMDRQYWREQGRSGFAFTDLLCERFWALGPESAADRGLLLSYTIGPKAERFDAMDGPARVAAALDDAERVFPGARHHFESARVKSWAEDPWVRGLSPDFRPGRLGDIALGAEREGRIHFAGEHTSRWTGWIQGAIDSAHRVVQEITAQA